jgi:hypothetical protein
MVRENARVFGQIAGVALVYLSLIVVLLYPAIHAARVA